MAEIIIIAAIADNNVIGKDNDIPWRLKGDFMHFKKVTLGHPCIMGDRTYWSLPANARPLPGRENVVLSKDPNFNEPGITICRSFEDALAHVKDKDKAYITGGASIYKWGLTIADKLELTRVHKTFEGDTYFPEIKWSEWTLEHSQDNEENGLKFTFETYKKK